MSSDLDASVGDEPEPWTRFDHPMPVAFDYVIQWCTAVQMQADRVLSTLGGIARGSEAALLIVALNNAERAARFASANASGEAATSAIDNALKQFDDAVPDVKAARNMIEHFDAYERGTGDSQQPGINRRTRKPDKAATDTFSVAYVGRDPNLLEIGPHRINVTGARDGASELLERVHQALKGVEKIHASGT